jgi:thioredoxin 1
MATLEITQENIESTVSDNDIVILDFWGPNCGPCHRFAPVFEEASDKHTDVVFGKIDTSKQHGLARELGIQAIPTLMVFRDNILLFRESGALPPPALEDLLTQVKALDMDEVRAEMAKQQDTAEA